MQPGSPEAQQAGCTCPVIDNANGSGVPLGDSTVGYWINGDCLIHGLHKSAERDYATDAA